MVRYRRKRTFQGIYRISTFYCMCNFALDIYPIKTAMLEVCLVYIILKNHLPLLQVSLSSKSLFPGTQHTKSWPGIAILFSHTFNIIILYMDKPERRSLGFKDIRVLTSENRYLERKSEDLEMRNQDMIRRNVALERELAMKMKDS